MNDRIAGLIEEMLPTLPQVAFTQDKTSVTVGTTTVRFVRSQEAALKVIAKLRNAKPYKTSLRKGSKEKFVCQAGPFNGQTLFLDPINPLTLPFTVNGSTGVYRGGTYKNKCIWYED